MNEQCPSCGGDCGRTKISGCLYVVEEVNRLADEHRYDLKLLALENAMLKAELKCMADDTRLLDDYNNLLQKYDSAQRKYAQLYDKCFGTPCEQIRHQQEVDDLRMTIKRFYRSMDYPTSPLGVRLHDKIMSWGHNAMRDDGDKGGDYGGCAA